jgi:formylglycine-generating enzyme required for sulfatase activity
VQTAHEENKTIVRLGVSGTRPSPGLRYFLGVRQQIPWTDAKGVAKALEVVFAIPAGQVAVREAIEVREVTDPQAPVIQGRNVPLIVPPQWRPGRRPGDVFRDTAECPEMVVIPPGTFCMGSPDAETGRTEDEGPMHEVHIRYTFAVSRYPITRAEWKRFVRYTDHKDDTENREDNNPVIGVSWQDAQDYVAWLTIRSGHRYRLLTEAEYEYANRAGSQTAYFWGDREEDLRRYANNKGLTAPVGSFEPNPFGLYDITSSFPCWTQDTWHPDYNGAPADGSAWETGGTYRVIRGGLSGFGPRWFRSASRTGVREDNEGVGFRLAKTLS